jgi:hypothetical protein
MIDEVKALVARICASWHNGTLANDIVALTTYLSTRDRSTLPSGAQMIAISIMVWIGMVVLSSLVSTIIVAHWMIQNKLNVAVALACGYIMYTMYISHPIDKTISTRHYGVKG